MFFTWSQSGLQSLYPITLADSSKMFIRYLKGIPSYKFQFHKWSEQFRQAQTNVSLVVRLTVVILPCLKSLLNQRNLIEILHNIIKSRR